jgi:threonylcarbamoyladenosine tRNA methylthiotransferase MtaB
MLNPIKRVAFHTFGCKLNFSETSYLSQSFKKQGFTIVDFEESADLYVVHTCAVTAAAEKKCRTLFRSIKRRAPLSKTAVIGCYAELQREAVEALPGVDMVLGSFDKYRLLDIINAPEKNDNEFIGFSSSDFIPAFSSGDRTRTFLKVQDGCDYFCTYCTIPYARGRSRSNNIAETIQIAQQAIQAGAQEIVLTGVNVGDFGRHHGETFFELLQALDAISWNGRIRLSSIEPELLHNEIIQFVADSKHIMPHFHVPLQSGSNKILELMHRRYRRELFAQRIEFIRKVLPFAFIAADVIVGFPEETEADFFDTYHLISDLEMSALHVFSFSARQGTLAAAMTGKISGFVKKERSQMLKQLSMEKKKTFVQKNFGRTEQVLFESEHDQGIMYGFTKNYIRVQAKYDASLVNKETTVVLNRLNHQKNEYILNNTLSIRYVPKNQ